MLKPKEKICLYHTQLLENSSARPELFNDTYNSAISQNYLEYMDSVERWNADRIMILMMVIHHHLQQFDPCSYSLLLVGSDARRENAPHSEFEFCIITDNDSIGIDIQKAILDHSCANRKAFSMYPSHRIPTSDAIIEIKNLNQPRVDPSYVISGYNGNPEHIWPDRVLHSQLVWGNPDLLSQAKKQVLLELSSMPKLTQKLARQGKNFADIAESGVSRRKGKLQRHFSLDDEKIFFRPDEYVLGLKYSVIRLVQNILLTSQIQSRDVMDDGNTLYLLERLFSHMTTLYQDVAQAYAKSLHMYHLQQQKYYETKSTAQATISLPQQELLALLRPALALFSHAKKQS